MTLQKLQLSHAIISAIAFICMALGLSVLLGWHLHSPTLIQWRPEYTGMVYNTALCFAISGTGLFAALWQRKISTLVISLVIIVISALSLLQDLLNFNPGIDHFFFQAYANFGDPKPGHMSPNSALELLLIATAFLISNCKPHRNLLVLLNYIGLIVTSIGAIAIFGYFANIPTAYSWSNFTHMAMSGAVGFSIMGAGLFALAWSRSLKYEIDLNYSLPVFTAVSIIIITLLLYQALISNAHIHPHLSNTILLVGIVLAILLGTAINLAQTARKSLSLTKAAFESTADAIMVTDQAKNISDYNQKFLKLWNIPQAVILPGQTEQINQFILHQLQEPEKYLSLIKELYNFPILEINNELTLKSGRIFSYHTQPQKIGEKIVGRVFTFRDITERKQMEEQLLHQATHDLLTGLPNRALLLDRLQQAITLAKHAHQRIAVLFFDLDRFKIVNDTLGHQKGDELLQITALRLKNCIRESDTLARLGGDEFVIILTDLEHEEDIVAIAQKCLASLANPFLIKDRQFNLTASVGISWFPADGHDASTLLKNADIAMYRSKESGGNNFQYYTSEMYARIQEHLELEHDLQNAIVNNELVLHYQPQLDLKTNCIIGAEALVRWQHPVRGMIMPQTFIPLAEESNLIATIGEWTVRTACQQNKTWQASGFPPLKIAVNLSGQQFKYGKIAVIIAEILQETGLAAEYLELELTESSVMKNTHLFISTMHELKKLGIGLAIDDFGTGYSSLSYLQQFPVDKLKIDQSFIKKIPADHDGVAIVLAILALAKSLKLRVVAEGVETIQQLVFLKQNDCDEIQGYYFSRPLDTENCTKFLAKHLHTD